MKKNEAKLAKLEGKGDAVNNEAFLDHGFTRPKVFFLCWLTSDELEFSKVKILLA